MSMLPITRKVLGGVSLLYLSFFVLVILLEQPLSVELMDNVIGIALIILWVIMPVISAVLSFSMFVTDKHFTSLIYIIVTLGLISTTTLLIYLNLATTDFGIIFVVLMVFGSPILFGALLLLKLLYAYIFKKNFKYIVKSLFNIQVLKALPLSAMVTVLLWQSFLIISAIEAHKAVEALNVKEANESSLFSFYRPFAEEIRLSNGMRWSYGRGKFVENGK